MPKTGRPSTYSREKADQICQRLAEGELLVDVCEDMGLVPQTVYRWLERHDDFRESYARARDIGWDVRAERLIRDAIAADGKDGAGVQAVRLRIDTEKWLLSKVAARRYGDKVAMEHTGKDGGPVQVVIAGEDKGLL